jgi:transposase-like protein
MADEERARVSRAEWAKRVERWRDSGLSAAEFATEIGVNPRTLTYWKWLLRQEARPKRPSREAATASRPAPAASAFVEVRSTPGNAAFELALGDGRRLQIPTSFDSDALARLLAVLERP